MSPIAYTAPTTRITGEVITSGNWNADIVENVKWFATDKPMVRAYMASNSASIASATITALAMDSERFDNSSLHSTSSNTSRITFATAGRYLIGASVDATPAHSSSTYMYNEIVLRINGTTYIARDSNYIPGDSATFSLYQSQSSFYSFAANEYVEVMWRQDNNGATAKVITAASAYSTELWATWIGTA